MYGGVAHVARGRLLGAAEQNVAEAFFLIAGDEVGKDGVGSRRGKHHHAMRPWGVTSAATRPLPMGATLRLAEYFICAF